MHVSLVGLGNIGSHAVQGLARIPEVSRLTLIDRDRYEARNLENQAIRPGDVGKPKAVVQARALRARHPGLVVEAICKSVEQIPLGKLRCDLLVAAVDTRITRQYLNEACWALGISWVDSGVHADAGLARISTFQPGADQACLECDWDDRHYATLEMLYSCLSPQAAPRTGASAVLGAVAGALLAMECGKLLAGEGHQARELVFDTQGYKHRVIEMRANPRCRFSHRALPVCLVALTPKGAPMSALFGLAGSGAALRVECAGAFARQSSCPTCGSRRLWTLAKRLTCGRCGAAVPVAGFDLVPQLREADLTKAILARPLTQFGICEGDILKLDGDGGEPVVLEVAAQVGGVHA